MAVPFNALSLAQGSFTLSERGDENTTTRYSGVCGSSNGHDAARC